ncbi:hypothetical protein AX16_011041 [Volvariella volvacea WC 439]|nr:hypothetical protein AX16_011041 [Volvariella volvacea WC 439]
MSGRPSFSAPVGATVQISVPPEWFISISAISRKTYHQAIFVQTNIRNNSSTFKSDYGTSGPMPDAISGSTTFPIAPRQTPVELTISAYYADTSGKLTAKAIRDPKYASSKLDLHSSVKPPTAAPEIPDYVTYFIFVEDTSDAAQVAGSGQFDDAVVTVHLVKTNPNPIPPPPPDNVIPGYNPVLDRPRPSTLDNYLKAYDVVFLLDDSGSMKGDRWTEARNALDGLANYIIDKGWDSDGIDLRFLNSNNLFQFKDITGVQDKGKVAEAINKVNPDGSTPTGSRTQQILGAHIDKLNAAKGTSAYGEIKPLDMICITDGEPNDDEAHELTKMLIEAGNKIKAGPHHPNSLGVQFVQIGGDANAAAALAKLVQADTGNIVDTVPYSGPGSISPDKLERILLGGLHPNIRAQRVP